MNSKILWSEADRVHKILTKPLKDGKLILSKSAKIDVDKVPHAVIEFKDKVVEGALYIMSTFGLVLGTLFTGNMIVGLCIMLVGILISMRLSKKRTIMFPFFFAKWNCCTPYDVSKKIPAVSYKVREKVDVQKLESPSYTGRFKILQRVFKPKRPTWNTVCGYFKELGELDFYEMKVAENPSGIPMYTPQDLEKIDKNTAMREIIKGDHGEKMNWPLMIIIMVLGLMMGLYLSPIITQYMTQAASTQTPPTTP